MHVLVLWCYRAYWAASTAELWNTGISERTLFDSTNIAFKNYSEEFDNSCSVGLEGRSDKCLQHLQIKKNSMLSQITVTGEKLKH